MRLSSNRLRQHYRIPRTILLSEITMSNPGEAFPNTRCESCQEEIGEGNPIFFDEGTKLCKSCAEDNNNICPR